jgi:predicted dehydrogenase
MTTAAVVGCGDVSVVHFEAIAALDGSELVAVCDVDPDTAARAAERYGVPGFASHTDLLSTIRPDVVHIATPHDQHVQPAIDSLAAGVNVVVEKPVAHIPSEAERLVAAAEQPGAPKIAVCFQNRYNATSQAMAELLGSGALGPVIGGSASVCWSRRPAYYESRPWRGQLDRSGGGVLINQAIHTVDLLQWLLGNVQEVRGRAYWGVSHQALIGDFYARLGDPEPFWIGPREGAKSLDILSRVYAGGITG